MSDNEFTCAETGCPGIINTAEKPTSSLQTGCDYYDPVWACPICGCVHFKDGGVAVSRSDPPEKVFFIDGEMKMVPSKEPMPASISGGAKFVCTEPGCAGIIDTAADPVDQVLMMCKGNTPVWACPVCNRVYFANGDAVFTYGILPERIFFIDGKITKVPALAPVANP